MPLPLQTELLPSAALPAVSCVAEEVVLLRRFAPTAALRSGIDAIAAAAPFRHLSPPGGGSI